MSERVDMIRRLAMDGLSSAEIARRLGVTKNVVAGLMHRNTIKSAHPSARRGEQRRPVLRLAASNNDPIRGCRWPEWGDEEAPTHRYCQGSIAAPGEPYCTAHRARAWIGIPQRRTAPTPTFGSRS